jgi:hypothetical protein
MSYDPFYEELIHINKNGGWGGLYYGIFSNVIKENHFKMCAEVGIGYGLHAREVLDNTKVEKLYLIDPVKYYPNDLFPEDVVRYGGFEKLLKNIYLHLSPYTDRYVHYRKESLTITNDDIPDGSLDAVFIDGDHSYEAVKQDLTFWWKKLRVGGWLLGDDYESCCPDVPIAVNEFAQTNNLPLEFIKKNTYPIYKFVKTK